MPTSPEGIIVFNMLVEAFRRRLSFIVGQSLTTGKKNTVVWSGIHHKTSMHGGPTSFGFPDPSYLDRVSEELEVRGISPEDVAYKQVNINGGSITQ